MEPEDVAGARSGVVVDSGPGRSRQAQCRVPTAPVHAEVASMAGCARRSVRSWSAIRGCAKLAGLAS